MMIGFNWLKSQQIEPAHAEIAQPPADRILQALTNPLPKGELSDRTGLKYAQLDPILKSLTATGKIRWGFEMINGLPVLHYRRASP